MKIHIAERQERYDGTQLCSLWAYREFGVQGDSIVMFRGPCEIPTENIVDLEDVRAGARIAGPDMIHFIVEHFDRDLEKAVLRQRVLVAAARDECGGNVVRRGDDLFVDKRKLSISIATLTPVSSKIHFALNIEPAKDVGVPTCGLSEIGVEPAAYGRAVAERYGEEIGGVDGARTKVRGVP